VLNPISKIIDINAVFLFIILVIRTLLKILLYHPYKSRFKMPLVRI